MEGNWPVLLGRRFAEHRPEVILGSIVFLCMVSLLLGTQPGFLRNFFQKTVSITSYPFVKSMDMAEGATDYAMDMFFSYNNMRNENQALHAEVATMTAGLARFNELELENERLREMAQFVRTNPRLSLEPAKVIQSLRGTLTLDRGSMHGIEKFMSVITPSGVVGVVTEVGYLTSMVATIHHVDCKVGAMVKRNRLRAYDGIVHPSGSDLNPICTMEYIDLKDDVRKGDEVVTSPESLFPSGYPIGVVSGVHGETGSLWKWADIEPAVDPYNLDEVFVVRNALPGAEDLEGPPPPDTPVKVAAATDKPDEKKAKEKDKDKKPAPISDVPMTVQERYAP